MVLKLLTGRCNMIEEEHEVVYNLDPVLLFTAVQGKNESGVYYVPQHEDWDARSCIRRFYGFGG